MKRFISLVAVLLIVTSSSAQLTSGLIAHWNFNGNANDVSGNSNNGTANNVTYVAGKTGLSNTAAEFNGTNSFITVPYEAQMNVTKISMCAVVYFDDFYNGLCQHSVILQRGSYFQPGSYSLTIFDNPYDNGNCNIYDSTKMVFHSKIANRENSVPLDSFKHTPNVAKKKWYCVVATCDSLRTKVYIDGVLKLTYSSTLPFGTSNDGLSIGANRFNQISTFPYWLNGKIDDLRLYNRELSAAEVSQYCGLFDTVVYVSQAFNDTLVCEDDTVQVQYGVTNNFQTGNVFTAQLSDATGGFGLPTNIGNVTSNTAGVISCNIPGGLTPSTNYRIRIVSTNPVRTSDISKSITVHPTLTPSVNITANPSGQVTAGTTITFTANSNGAGTNPTYQWLRNGLPISNATNSTLAINTLNDGDSICVVVYSSNMCPANLNDTSNKIVAQISSSVYDIELENLRLYPNPNSGSFTLSASSVKNSELQIEVLNSVGQIVYRNIAKPNNGELRYQIHLNDVPSGVYLLRMTAEEQHRNIKFMVK